MNVCVLPPGTVTGDAMVDVLVMPTPPVGAAVGGAGDGTTPSAAASPVFDTVIASAKPWPRLICAGSENTVTVSAAGCCTVACADVTAGDVTVRAAAVSRPDAVAVARSVPLAVPFSVNATRNVARMPPAMLTGAT